MRELKVAMTAFLRHRTLDGKRSLAYDLTDNWTTGLIAEIS